MYNNFILEVSIWRYRFAWPATMKDSIIIHNKESPKKTIFSIISNSKFSPEQHNSSRIMTVKIEMYKSVKGIRKFPPDRMSVISIWKRFVGIIVVHASAIIVEIVKRMFQKSFVMIVWRQKIQVYIQWIVNIRSTTKMDEAWLIFNNNIKPVMKIKAKACLK